MNVFENVADAVEYFCETLQTTSVKFDYDQDEVFILMISKDKWGEGISYNVWDNSNMTLDGVGAPQELINEKITLIDAMLTDYFTLEAIFTYVDENPKGLSMEGIIEEDKVVIKTEYGQRLLAQYLC